MLNWIKEAIRKRSTNFFLVIEGWPSLFVIFQLSTFINGSICVAFYFFNYCKDDFLGDWSIVSADVYSSD